MLNFPSFAWWSSLGLPLSPFEIKMTWRRTRRKRDAPSRYEWPADWDFGFWICVEQKKTHRNLNNLQWIALKSWTQSKFSFGPLNLRIMIVWPSTTQAFRLDMYCFQMLRWIVFSTCSCFCLSREQNLTSALNEPNVYNKIWHPKGVIIRTCHFTFLL